MTSSALKALAGAVLLAVALLVLSFRGVDWEQLAGTLAGARLDLLGVATLIGSVPLLLRGIRWWTLLKGSGEVQVRHVCSATALGYLANSYLPARSGDVLRCGVVASVWGCGISVALSTTVAERLLDVVALAAIAATTLAVLDTFPIWLEGAVAAAGLAAILALGGLVVLERFEDAVVRALLRFQVLGRFRDRTIEVTRQAMLGIRAVRTPSTAAVFFGITAAIWLADGVGAVVAAQSLGLPLTLPQAVVLLAALGLGSALPSTPGFVGIYQFVAVTVLVPYGYTQSQALAYILIMQASYYGVVTVVGFAGLWNVTRPGIPRKPKGSPA